VNYAGVAGDANPIHWDESLAKLAGLPDVIAHGMLTMGLGAGFVSAWSGDPGAVTRYGAAVPARRRLGSPGLRYRVHREDQVAGPRHPIRGGAGWCQIRRHKIFGLATLEMRFS
jgi:hypothetical protein